ncbi:D-alanyl-D-alanine carboxypeptidase family protein [Pararhodobacter sp.]|uniref:D-alanyl-D-alanine carboxypeptidase family protein n=1 Tax=Pararhodobacter sp. TaxID=2127056 RepID=UPI002AFE976D|nr:D-alanyl-D-alanine carboxypeptidase family protein [Pararhodobacter sp.]
MQTYMPAAVGCSHFGMLGTAKALVRISLAVVGLLFSSAASADEFAPAVRSISVYDIPSHTVMLEQNADVAMPPASMTKLMTLYILFEALEMGRVQLEDRMAVSAYAANRGGSTMFLDTRDNPTIEDLIRGIIVMSGNDAAITVAEGLAGTEGAFTLQMNSVAQRIGMEHSHFLNASGWPEAGHEMSARDLGALALSIIEEFPQHYHFFSQPEFSFDNRAPANRFNRNPILGLNIGGDGLKTGHTDEAGYGFVGSAVQGNRRIVFAFMGAQDANARAQIARDIVLWAYGQFRSRQVLRAGDILAQAEVWLGEQRTVPLTVASDVTILLPTSSPDDVQAMLSYLGPITAPIHEGQEVGHLSISLSSVETTHIPVVAAENVRMGGFSVRISAAATVLANLAMRHTTSFLTQEEE